MTRKIFSLALILTLAIAVALAQEQTSNAPSVDRLRQIVTYLASDPLEGRRTGTKGAIDAADYIAREFKRYGLSSGKPAIRSASYGVKNVNGEPIERYLQAFPYVSGVKLGEKNSFVLNSYPVDGVPVHVTDDWTPLGFSSNASIEAAEIVFAGYGISSSELKYDDYAVSKAKDRAAIVFAGTPDGDNPHGQFTQAGQIRFKAAAARAAGARALLIIANEEKLQDDRLSRLSYDNAGEAGLPVLVISRQLAQRILTLGRLADYQAAADSRSIDKSAGSGANTAVLQIPRALALRAPIDSLTLTLSTDVVRRESPSFNVVGVLRGSDSALEEAIVIGAHYDHLGLGGEGSLAPREGEIHHGADDNASGVAGLLELARILSTQKPKPRRTIVFIAFSGEEEGLIGSNYYVNHPVVPLANTIAMINLDMIGRMKEKNLIIGGVGTASEWREIIRRENTDDLVVPRTELGNPDRKPGKVTHLIGANGQMTSAVIHAVRFDLSLNEDGYGPSDHSSFYAKQIPVLFFWTGTHSDYHKPSDTAEKINYEGEARIVEFVANIVQHVDRTAKRPTYMVAKSESQGRSTGFRVYLGTIPNYADSNDGLKLDGVRDDSPAARAGLKADDKIVKIAGREIKNVYDYTYALGEMKAGQEYEIEVVRGSERLTLKIKPEARK